MFSIFPEVSRLATGKIFCNLKCNETQKLKSYQNLHCNWSSVYRVIREETEYNYYLHCVINTCFKQEDPLRS